MTRPSVLILGANGRLGAAAVKAFAGAGWQVLAQARCQPGVPLPAGVVAVPAALHDTTALAAQAQGARHVVYAVNPVYTRWQSELLPVARQGMDLAQRLGARFMLPGNVYNFGAQMPALLRENTPQRPSTPKGELRCQLESELQARSQQGGMQAVVIRAGDFYGAGRGSWMDQAIVKHIHKGHLTYPGPLDVPHAWAYLPDLARAFVAVAERPQSAAFQSLHFAGHCWTGTELLRLIEDAAGDLGWRPAAGFRHRSLPWGLITAVGAVYPTWRELARMRYLWQVPHALDGRALQQLCGAPASTAPAQAMRQTLLDLQLQGSPAASALQA
jgi:nucleoside-diphosphate-sugar epimerase